MKDIIKISAAVKKALKANAPVVALESTIISHGMPYPQNVETAMEVEKLVRENGATPATVAIIGGVPKIGLTAKEIDYMGQKGGEAAKISRRDIPAALVKKLDGATTVSATMCLANLAGIKVFATGGIGGAHRDAQKTFDISADLDELARTPVIVVCAGAKAILDLELTREYLETKGVAVYGYQTDQMPAFYSKTSGLGVDYTVDTPEEAAEIFALSQRMGLSSGMLLTVPISDEYAMQEHYVGAIIDQAIREAQEEGVTGKGVTPYLLKRVSELTGGKSLTANIKLMLGNAEVASRVAAALSKRTEKK